MNVMHTTLSGGNAPLAAVGAVLSNIIAIWVTPALLGLLDHLPPVDQTRLVLDVGGKMIVPLLVGQALRPHLQTVLTEKQAARALAARVLVTLLLFQVASDLFYWGRAISAATLAKVVAASAALHVAFAALAYGIGAWLLDDVADRAAYTFCAAQKTVVLGLPLLRACFADRTPQTRATVLLPLICYHLFSLVFGFAIAPRLRTQVEAAAQARAALL